MPLFFFAGVQTHDSEAALMYASPPGLIQRTYYICNQQKTILVGLGQAWAVTK
jgi:hypothetical protein